VLVVKHHIGISLKGMKKYEWFNNYGNSRNNSRNNSTNYSYYRVGATLTTPLEFNLIGASDNTVIGSARANVTSVDFIQEVGSNGVIQINGTTFSVGN